MYALPPRIPDGFSMTFSSGRLTSSIYFPTTSGVGLAGEFARDPQTALSGCCPWRVLLPGPPPSVSHHPFQGTPRPTSCWSLLPLNTKKLLWSTNPPKHESQAVSCVEGRRGADPLSVTLRETAGTCWSPSTTGGLPEPQALKRSVSTAPSTSAHSTLAGAQMDSDCWPRTSLEADWFSSLSLPWPLTLWMARL